MGDAPAVEGPTVLVFGGRTDFDADDQAWLLRELSNLNPSVVVDLMRTRDANAEARKWAKDNNVFRLPLPAGDVRAFLEKAPYGENVVVLPFPDLGDSEHRALIKLATERGLRIVTRPGK